MKKTLFVLFALVLLIGNINFVQAADFKVGVVDVTKVVEASSQVQALKREQQAKTQELNNWLTKVRADIAKQKTQANQEALVKKYDAEFVKKQEAIAKAYSAKLQAIDNSITATIVKEGKAMGYDIVIAKNVVFYGGTDITAAIMKKVK